MNEQALRFFALHADPRPPVWSQIVTVFGDLLAGEGELPLALLTSLLAAQGIEAGAVRAALSRLAADGWVVARREGRSSHYRLTARALADTRAASPRIYARQAPEWQGILTFIVISEGAGEARDALRARLRAVGFGHLGPASFWRPETALAQPFEVAGALVTQGRAQGYEQGQVALPDLAAQAWPLAALGQRWQAFMARWQGQVAPPEPLAALALRLTLIHDFRRIVLSDPALPLAFLPSDWPGIAARRLTARLWHDCTAQAGEWLTAQGLSTPADRF